MKDPVCGMEVGAGSRFSSSYKGKSYRFCSLSCKQGFDKDPERFAKG